MVMMLCFFFLFSFFFFERSGRHFLSWYRDCLDIEYTNAIKTLSFSVFVFSPSSRHVLPMLYCIINCNFSSFSAISFSRPSNAIHTYTHPLYK